MWVFQSSGETLWGIPSDASGVSKAYLLRGGNLNGWGRGVRVLVAEVYLAFLFIGPLLVESYIILEEGTRPPPHTVSLTKKT